MGEIEVNTVCRPCAKSVGAINAFGLDAHVILGLPFMPRNILSSIIPRCCDGQNS